MKARCLVTAILAIGIFTSSGVPVRAQGSITLSFGDQDRQAMREWYRDHYNAPEFQNRRWNDQAERRLQAGTVLAPDMRGWARPAPQDLYRRLAPLPRDYRYVIVGDHVVAVEGQWMIYDVYHFERFQDSDQQAMHDWYAGHRDAREFDGRQRWNDQMEQRIQIGAALDPDLRRLARPAPADLVSRLPARPRYLRYVIVGDHICLIDNRWTVRDVLHFDREGDSRNPRGPQGQGRPY
jgi:hypothetical protein